MNIKETLERWLGRKAPQAHQPYDPTPPGPNAGASGSSNMQFHHTNADAAYTETETDIQNITGTGISFGTQKVVQVGNNGQANCLSQAQSHILGSGKLISKLEDVAGVCNFCKLIAAQQLQAGQISIAQAQLMSLYDRGSAAICNICGIQGCIRHINPKYTASGIITICIACQKQLKKQERKRKLINFLLSPFVETNGDQ